jgi:GNAT acetyltransferase-like protein
VSRPRDGAAPAIAAPSRPSAPGVEMTSPNWLPADFLHPTFVALTDSVHLRPIRATDVDIDMVAVHGNQTMLWTIYGEAWQWPPTTMTREQDEADLARHAAEMETHQSFNYAVLPADESALLGCVYISPVEAPGYQGDAEVSWWVAADADRTVRCRLDEFVPGWVTTAWPFTTVVYPFNQPPGAATRR